MHYLVQYPPCSTPPLSDDEIVKIVGRVVGKDIKGETRPLMEATEALSTTLFGSAANIHPSKRDGAQRMILFSNYRGIKANPNVLE